MWKGSAASCFAPRHGLSASQGSDRVDFVICFECQQLEVYRSSGSAYPDTSAGIDDVQGAFDRVLADHGLARSP
jgi:hypothetical protein